MNEKNKIVIDKAVEQVLKNEKADFKLLNKQSLKEYEKMIDKIRDDDVVPFVLNLIMMIGLIVFAMHYPMAFAVVILYSIPLVLSYRPLIEIHKQKKAIRRLREDIIAREAIEFYEKSMIKNNEKNMQKPLHVLSKEQQDINMKYVDFQKDLYIELVNETIEETIEDRKYASIDINKKNVIEELKNFKTTLDNPINKQEKFAKIKK